VNLLGFGLYAVSTLSGIATNANGDFEWTALNESGETYLRLDNKTFDYPANTLSIVTLIFSFIGTTGAAITEPATSLFSILGLPGTVNDSAPLIPGGDGVAGYKFGGGSCSIQLTQTGFVPQDILGFSADRSSKMSYTLASGFLIESGGSELIPSGQLTITTYG